MDYAKLSYFLLQTQLFTVIAAVAAIASPKTFLPFAGSKTRSRAAAIYLSVVAVNALVLTFALRQAPPLSEMTATPGGPPARLESKYQPPAILQSIIQAKEAEDASKEKTPGGK